MSTGGKKEEAPPKKKRSTDDSAEPTEGPSLWVRVLLTLVLAFHVFIIFFYPFAYSSKPSPTATAIARSPWLRWYAEPLYLNHGHGFFGPDPGPSMIVEYEYQVVDDKGQVIKQGEGVLPDADRMWPRLRYHRYKMLADQVEMPHPDIANRRPYVLTRFAQQLVRQYNAESVTVTEKVVGIVPYEEWLGQPDLAIEGRPIDDPQLVQQQIRITQTKADVEAADAKLLGSAEETPAPGTPVETIPEGVPNE
ncbi:hypothetical protein [Aeoliella mucimassa]|uniref:Uncharacterized protein n=1 Tax=Aeoliella mucimassa TaxID=2527972 RepID=A0A518AM88_9BACT|nr:hypothetical protein [Aeoliella mucimassa]QDU55839.1 hypothetical protein Pan181_20360 [Aeoliella mucimassa]